MTRAIVSPQPDQLAEYQDVLERLNASIAFKSLDRDLRDTVGISTILTKSCSSSYYFDPNTRTNLVE